MLQSVNSRLPTQKYRSHICARLAQHHLSTPESTLPTLGRVQQFIQSPIAQSHASPQLESLHISDGIRFPRPRCRLTHPVFPVLPAKSPSNPRRSRLYVLYDPIDCVARSREILRDFSAPSFAMLVSNRIACFNLIGRDNVQAISQRNKIQRQRQHRFQSKFKDKRFDYNTVRSHLLDSTNVVLDHIYTTQ